MLDSEAYKTYHAYATAEKTPKPKKKKADFESSPKEKPAQASKGKRLKTSSKAAQSTKEKQPAIKSKAKGLTVLSEVALTEDEQMKLATKRSQIQTHNSHASGSGDGVNTLSKVPDEQPQKKSGTDKGAGDKPEVPDMKKAEDDEDMTDQRVHTPPDYQLFEKSENQEDDDMEDGEEYVDEEMLYGDLNLNRERIDAGMTKAHATKDTEDANVNPTVVTPVAQQQSSSASDLVSKFINPSMDEGIDSVLNQNIQSDTLVDIPVTTGTETPSSDTTTLQPSTLHIHSLIGFLQKILYN
ncbi:hypothetical protein Tco_0215070 [Tanacetum coccineum]